MPHAIWKGNISFGLIYIPVALYSAEDHRSDVKFSLIDKRDLSPIGYQKINKNTGRNVAAEHIVEGFEYDKDQYVLLNKDEKKKIQMESEQSIKIMEFVPENEIKPEFFIKPYYLEPIGQAKGVYTLFREALRHSNKIGIAKIIIRTKEYLSALLVDDDALVLELLRFQSEIIDKKKFDFPEESKISKNEILMAEKLINSMSGKWQPSKYKNDYRDRLLSLVTKKIKKGKAYDLPKELMHPEEPKENGKGKVIDIMSLLKKSIEKAKSKHIVPSKRKAQ